MTSEQKPVTARELLARGWELTQQSMGIVGLAVPHYIHFLIDDRRQIRATRVAELDELARAIDALDQDIERLLQGAPALSYADTDIEELRRDRAALIELKKRTNRTKCPQSTTVLEALFPDIPVKKKTASEKADDERWLAIRKEAGLKIDPETAEVDWSYGLDLDPYGIFDEWELPEEFQQVGRQYWARSPGSDVWVDFGDVPREVRDRLWARHRSQIAFPAGLEGAVTDDDMPF